MKAKKSLGQNFLKSVPALKKIIEAGDINPDDTILEIGPGKGALTEKLLERAKLIIAVEKDRTLFQFLKIKFEKEISKNKLVLLCEDILDFEIKNYAFRNYKIIANIPYNITGAILKKFLTEEKQPVSMVLMVQHEVAKRIVARDGKESVLSISIKAYGEPKLIIKVPARYFSPAPRVDSAIIAINNISRKIFVENKLDEKNFWEIVKTGFLHKRKILARNLVPLLKEKVFPILAKAGIKENTRAENLSLEEWIKIATLERRSGHGQNQPS